MAERYELVTRSEEIGADDRTAEEIRQDIAARRESISETVDKLSERVQRTLDWRVYVGEHPLLATGVAVGAGLLLANLFRPQSTPRDRILTALSETVEDVADRFRGQFDQFDMRPSSTPHSLQAAAVTMLTKVAVDYLSNQFLGKSSTDRNSTQHSNSASQEASARHATSGFE